MKSLISIITAVFIIYGVTVAQKPEFNVLAANGKCFVKKKSKNWTELTTGDKLYKEDQVKLNKNAYLGLVHATGKTEELTKEGTYLISKLSEEVARRKSNLSKRFAKYVVDEVSDVSDLTSRTNYKKQMSITGSVERAAGDEVDAEEKSKELTKTSGEDAKDVAAVASLLTSVSQDFIFCKLPRNSYLIDPETTFSWYKGGDGSKYKFKIEDRKGSVVYTREVGDTSLTLNLDKLKLDKEECYYWSVSSGKAVSDEFCIFRLDLDKHNELRQDYMAVLDDAGTDPGPLGLITLASFFEENNIMSNAYMAYKKAYEQAPDVDNYKKMFISYLYRIGLDREARILLSAK